MPRNRKRKPPTEPARAGVRWLDREELKPTFNGKVYPKAEVKCDHCGTIITWITDHAGTIRAEPVLGGSRFSLDTFGYYWDGEVWRDTPYTRRQRQRVREAVAVLPARESASKRDRLRRNDDFNRSGWRRDPPQGAGNGRPAEIRDAGWFPTKWMCWRCSAVNIIEVD